MAIPTRKIVLFLGAGASAKAGVPPTFEFAEAFHKDLVSRTSTKAAGRRVDPGLVRVLDQLLRVLRRWKRRSTPSDDRVDVELLLEALTVAGSLKDQVASALHYGYPVTVAGKKKELDALLNLLQRFVREKCYIGLYAAEYLSPLLRFVKANKPVHVFTVNYDVVMEQFLERNTLQFTDGFDLNWNPAKFLDDRYEAYLYKLHGSVTWYQAPNGTALKLPIRMVQPRFLLATGGMAQPLMLYPAQKWVNSGVYLRLLSLLHETLAECDYVFVVGYSFRDDHFVRAFQEAAWANPKLRIILVGPHAEDVYEERLRWVQDSPMHGAKSRSELTGRVFRYPFSYERLIGSLYSIVWSDVTDAVNSDALAKSQAEGGGVVRWHEVALKYLEAGQLERAAELEESDIDWLKVGDAYPVEFFGKKAVLLSLAGRAADARKAWERVRSILERWLLKELSFEFLGDAGVRLKLASTSTGAKSTDQLKTDMAGLLRFSRRYIDYFEDEFPLTREIIDRLLIVDEYLGAMPTIGVPLETYVKSRASVVPKEAAKFVDHLTGTRAKGPSATAMTEELMADFLSVERAYILAKMEFLGEIPVDLPPSE